MGTDEAFWASARMRAAVAADDVGAVIRLARLRAQLNQTQLGQQCGYSTSTISRIERGQPPSQDVHVRRRIGEALGIPMEFLGLAPLAEGRSVQPSSVDSTPIGHPGVRVVATEPGRGDPMRRRDLLSGVAASAAATALPWPEHQSAAGRPGLADLLQAETTVVAPPKLSVLARQLREARQAFGASRYDELTRLLFALIAGAAAGRRDGRAEDRESVMVVLAAGYRLASELSVKRNDDALAWVLADRALSAAQATGRNAPVAHASRSVAIAMRRAGHHTDAITLLSNNAEKLHPGTDATDADLATYGALLCTAAYASAQSGARRNAETFLSEAVDAAGRLSAPVNAGEITFSATNVAGYQISVFTSLGDSAAALDHAARVDVRQLGTSERYARYCIDTARAWELHGRPDRATQALAAAEAVAPEELRRPSSHELITRMLYSPTITPSGLRSLAARVGAIS
ncbi:helix-turn-helix transcriptional regulator [Actinoplanes sp. NPDC049316]|uniref:helix-turn-helix domain-containing protein n=1 Tax=Actinoplanes sp. NPDC049316 TaxID=3154727 RepID=UPI003436BACE